jgi:hypothetical protein
MISLITTTDNVGQNAILISANPDSEQNASDDWATFDHGLIRRKLPSMRQ